MFFTDDVTGNCTCGTAYNSANHGATANNSAEHGSTAGANGTATQGGLLCTGHSGTTGEGNLRIPEQVGHQFRSNPATDSVSFRPGIPVESGH